MTSTLDREPHASTRFGPSPDEARMLLQVAFRPVGLLLAAVTVVVLVTLVSANSDLTGTFGGLAAMWLAVHQVPLGIAGATLSILPLLPTAVLVIAVSNVVAKGLSESSTRRDIGWTVGAALGGPLALSAVMLAMIQDASTVIALGTPSALATFGWVLAVHGIGVAIGVLRGTWPAVMRIVVIPPWSAAALDPAARAAAVLLAGGSVVVAGSLVMSWSTLGALLDTGGGVGGALGLTALSILYLPNAVVAAAAVATGSSAHVGAATVSVFETTGGDVPAVPLLAVMPETAAQAWWPVMLLVPVVAAVVLGRACAQATATLLDAVRAACGAAVVVGVGSLLVGIVAGGAMGTFGELGIDVLVFAGAAFAWCLVLGVATAAVVAHRMRGHRRQPWDDDPEFDHPDTGAASLPPVAELTTGADADAGESATVEEPESEPVSTGTPATDTAAAEADVVDAEIVELPAEDGADSPPER